MQADEVGQSVYDLGEDEQLALAMQQSLAESLEEEPGACPDPDSAAGVFPGAAADAGLAPETEAPEEVLTSPAPVPGGWEGVLPPPVAPPAPEGERDFHASSNDPEWAGSAAEEAAGGTVQVTQPPRPPPPQRPSGSGEAFAKQVPPRPQPRPAANSRLLDEVWIHKLADPSHAARRYQAHAWHHFLLWASCFLQPRSCQAGITDITRQISGKVRHTELGQLNKHCLDRYCQDAKLPSIELQHYIVITSSLASEP
eukprot:s792_g2.t1